MQLRTHYHYIPSIYDLQTEATWMSKTNNQGWNNICKDIVTEEEIKNLTDSIRLNYERCGEQGTQGRRDKAIDFWNIFKNGTIENNTTVNHESINAYVNSVGGTSAKEHGGGTGTQCVELPNHYVEEVFGHKNNGGFGNGNEYYIGITSAYPDTFQKIQYSSEVTLRTGDIISLEGASKQYGHAAIVKSVEGTSITVLEQWDGSGTVRTSTFTLTNSGKRRIIGIARPK